MSKLIQIPGGRLMTPANHTKLIQWAKANPHGWCPQWGEFRGATGAQIVFAFRRACESRLNDRGGIASYAPSPKRIAANEKRIARKLRETVTCRCRWCGSEIGKYAPKHQRFCDASCYMSHNT